MSDKTDAIEHDAWKQEKSHAAAYLEAMMSEVFVPQPGPGEVLDFRAMKWGYELAIQTLEGK